MRTSRVSWLLLAGLALIGTPGANAEKAPDPVKAPPAKAGESAMPAWIKVSTKDARLYDIDFPGGTLAEYYRGVSLAPGAKTLIPLVVSEQAEKVRLQALSLKDAGVYALYQLPPQLIPGVTLNDAGFANFRDADGKDLMVGAYVVGVAPGLTEASVRPAATFNLNFPGGNVEQYVKAIREVSPNANIVITGDAAKRPVPTMQFRDVTLATAMEALGGHDADPSGGTWRVFVDRIGHEGAPESVYKVVGDVAMPDFGVVQPYDLGPVFRGGKRKATDVLSAVEAAMAMYPASPTIKYHEATQTLLVRGSDEQQKTVARLLSQLQSAPAEPPAP